MEKVNFGKFNSEHLDIGNEVLYLTKQDCIQSGLSPDDIYQLVEKSLIYHGRKEIDMPARIGIHPQKNSVIHAMPAHVPCEHVSGVKWGACFTQNRGETPSSIASGLVILNDEESGVPVAIMDGTWLTSVRTPAVTMVGVKYLANASAETFGMIGCGVLGQAHVKHIEKHLPKLKRIHIYDSSELKVMQFIEEFQLHAGVEIVNCQSLEEIVKSSEVITSATAILHEPEPQISDEWIVKGQTIFQCDLHSLFEDKTVRRADKYIVDSIDQHDLLVEYGYYPQGLPEIYGEIGDIAAGFKKGRESSLELIINNNIGMAVEDIVIAKAIFVRALQNGLGQKLRL